jgi:hypothetical protein
MSNYMIALVALDLILRIFPQRAVRGALVVEVGTVNSNDAAARPATFRIPADMIANGKFRQTSFLSHALGEIPDKRSVPSRQETRSSIVGCSDSKRKLRLNPGVSRRRGQAGLACD